LGTQRRRPLLKYRPQSLSSYQTYLKEHDGKIGIIPNNTLLRNMHSIVEQEKNTRTSDINKADLGYVIRNTTTHFIYCFNNTVRQIDLLGILVRLS